MPNNIQGPDITNKINSESNKNSADITREDKIDLLLDKLKEAEESPINSTTKKAIVAGIFIAVTIVVIGWGWGKIPSNDALVIVSSAITGGFALLRIN